MMRVLITGAAGFVGRYVVEALKKAGDVPLATDMRADASAGVEAVDICDKAAVLSAVRRLRPDACIHLAGVAFVPDAAKNPKSLASINVDGAVNVAEALLVVNPEARMLFVSTAQVYGYKYRDEAMSVEDELRPASPYAVSKAEAEAKLMALHFERGLNLCIARPGNHTGPGQSSKFVVPAFVAAVRDVRDGRRKTISVGNLDCVRDFSDVRDVVDAYMLILKKGTSGGKYNISSGAHMTIGEVLARIKTFAGVDAPAETLPELFRPTDAMPPLHTTHMRGLGWKPKYTFDQTLCDIWNSK